MAQVKILLKGYVSADSLDQGSCSTIVLVRDENLKMVIDPGTVKDQKMIEEALKIENLKISDINLVGITHSHMDHYRNIGMFKEAKVVDFWGIWNKDQCQKLPAYLTPNIQIIKTPGHSDDGLTFLVKTEQGIVAICGDVFWKENYPEKDLYANNLEKLKESREQVLKMADLVIPGHGDMFA